MWNTKIKCKYIWDKLYNRDFIKGEIYNVVNGKVILPDGTKSNGTYDCIEKLNECFYVVFEEVENEFN